MYMSPRYTCIHVHNDNASQHTHAYPCMHRMCIHYMQNLRNCCVHVILILLDLHYFKTIHIMPLGHTLRTSMLILWHISGYRRISWPRYPGLHRPHGLAPTPGWDCRSSLGHSYMSRPTMCKMNRTPSVNHKFSSSSWVSTIVICSWRLWHIFSTSGSFSSSKIGSELPLLRSASSRAFQGIRKSLYFGLGQQPSKLLSL